MDLTTNFSHQNAGPPESILPGSADPAIEIELRGDVCLLRIRGPFRTGTDPEYLSAKMNEIRALNCTSIVADFQAVTSIGSTALSFIVGLYRLSSAQLVLVGTQPRVREVLRITRLDTLIPLVSDIESGRAALHNPATLTPSGFSERI
jgi:anti-anti-sigma factor